jgi:hypothetical protein
MPIWSRLGRYRLAKLFAPTWNINTQAAEEHPTESLGHPRNPGRNPFYCRGGGAVKMEEVGAGAADLAAGNSFAEKRVQGWGFAGRIYSDWIPADPAARAGLLNPRQRREKRPGL